MTSPLIPEGAADQTARTATCPEHGSFISKSILFGRRWSPCPLCVENERAAREAEERVQAEERARIHHQSRLMDIGLPARFTGNTFDTFIADTDEKRRALSVARDYVDQFADNLKHGRGLIFAGLPGTGKTHLACAILEALIKRDVGYVTCLDMIRTIRATWRRDSAESELEVLREYGNRDLLVIDEIGVQYGTDGEQTIIFDVLDRRYREVLPTILLTNQDAAGLKDYIGERTYDRLTESCRLIAFDWPSHRVQAKKDGRAVSRERRAPLDPSFRGAI